MNSSIKAKHVLASCLLGAFAALAIGFWPRERHNLVLIVVDALRADAISSSAGAADTPAFDELAREGALFPRAFAHAPMTLPAHTALFSSRQPFETGVTVNGQTVGRDGTLLAEWLRGHGYQTAAAVSLATLWPQAPGGGLDRGFERYDPGTHEAERAPETAKRAIQLLRGFDPDRPFFLFAHFSDPHEPYNEYGNASREAQIALDGEPLDRVTTSKMSYWERELELPPGEHRLRFSSDAPFKLRRFACEAAGRSLPTKLPPKALMESTRKLELTIENSGQRTVLVKMTAWVNDVPSLSEIRERYQREVEAVDRAVASVIAELRRSGRWENTLVVLTADHGEALGEHGTVGHVVNLYDELLQVPLVIRDPRPEMDVQLRDVCATLVRQVDVAPTILELLGLSRWSGMSGRSVLTVMPRLLVAETHAPEAPRTLFAMRDDQYKLIYDPQSHTYEMYRLGLDPLELDNVFSREGHLRGTWQVELKKLAASAPARPALSGELASNIRSLGY